MKVDSTFFMSFFVLLLQSKFVIMKVYDAIRQMEELTRAGKTFSFSFMSYSYDKNVSHGPVTVLHAKLLPSNRKERNQYSDYMLRYRDMDTYEDKMCWQPLLLELNGEQLELV